MIQQNLTRVLVLDTSAAFQSIIRQAIQGDRNLSMLAESGSGGDPEAVARKASPDVIVLNELSGQHRIADLLNRLKPSAQTNYAPCIVVGEGLPETVRTVGEHDAEFVRMPASFSNAGMGSFANEFCTIVKLAAAAAISMRVTSPRPAAAVSVPAVPAGTGFRYNLIAIGASTGGTEATAKILESLPANMPGIVITQHMPETFTKMYAERLDRISKLSVSEAKDGDRVLPGTAFVAPGGLQMSLKKDVRGYYVHCAPGEKVNGHCPSVGVLFDSVAKCAGSDAIGVLLTGMGQDGAHELLHMREAGAFTIGQDHDSCVVYGMPMVAYNVGAVMQQLPLDRIADTLVRRMSK